MSVTWPVPTPYGIKAYTAREWDPETGLYYYRARYYDPKIGRFISEDPIGLQGGDVNFYAYVDNNPVRFLDPLGLLKIDFRIQYNKMSGPTLAGGCGFSKPTTLMLIGVCTEDCRDEWKLEFTFIGRYSVWSTGPRTKAHEELHIKAQQQQIVQALSYVVPFERRRYRSEAECEQAKEEAKRLFWSHFQPGAGQPSFIEELFHLGCF